MKFNFKIQQYQTDAVEAAARVFQGQPWHTDVSWMRAVETSQESGQTLNLPDFVYDSGLANEALHLTDEELLHNIQALQNESNILQSSGLVEPLGRCSLDIEMETGTGKTYVYIKTMFEMNRRYGWSKFIVVVPSVAIREGVKKIL